jgi:hypothetical protein
MASKDTVYRRGIVCQVRLVNAALTAFSLTMQTHLWLLKSVILVSKNLPVV